MSKAFTAPGKALLAGGYLVLDPIYDAYVTALSSRMHAIITEKESIIQNSLISISSPQFKNGNWQYKIEDNKPIEVNNLKNPFIESILFIILSYFQPTTNFNLEIKIFSDPGYHSQENTTSKTSSNGKLTFLYHDRSITEVEKTGLGSSAGLVSVITAALVSYFKVEIISYLDFIHNIAQIAHCLAQKKIGSGFDIATAIYGSIIYQRFEPKILDNLFETLENKPQEFNEKLRNCVNSNWNFKHVSRALPSNLTLLMGDIKNGSETPKLVSKILQWRKDKPKEAETVYEQLNAANMTFMDSLKSGDNKHISNSIYAIRKNLQILTKLSGVPVEPAIQTELLDKIALIDGCLGGVVPGAGGFDAIAVLVESDKVEYFKKTTEADVNNYNNVYWVNLHEESNGLIEENLENYVGL
ncbi:unnamed protein product [Candida verbasci]|uniref:phosphomevalonate kinase n=1 Tax=Candida verbasci TaxID=1227364 RepID=A0A9W4XBC2_9ASCO|nr:unnamed protein product [Candida verbasci]